MSEPRWEWMIPGGTRVVATIDTASGIEQVFVGTTLVSSSARGARPEGHAFTVSRGGDEAGDPPYRVVAKFQPGALICVLRVDDQEVSPLSWPVKKRDERPPPSERPVSLGGVLVAAALVAAVGAALGVRALVAAPREQATMSGAHRAANGLFVAHFPPELAASVAVVPSSMSAVVLEDKLHADAVVIVAAPHDHGLLEPWIVHKRLFGEALANLPRSGAEHEEGERSDDTCVGERGAVVVGRVKNRRGEDAKLWSCAFVHDSAGYLVMYAVRATATSDDEARLRRIVEATELTNLADMTSR